MLRIDVLAFVVLDTTELIALFTLFPSDKNATPARFADAERVVIAFFAVLVVPVRNVMPVPAISADELNAIDALANIRILAIEPTIAVVNTLIDEISTKI